MLATLTLTEPLVTALVQLLTANLNGEIDAVNATVTDGYQVPHAQQILPYVPVPSTLQGGMPAVGVQRISTDFQEDLQSSMDATHFYAIVAVIQHADQLSLHWQLERMLQAVANTVQSDRVLDPRTSVMRSVGQAWSVNFVRSEPGPMLGDLDPTNPAAPPRVYLSWVGLVLSSKKTEV